MRHLRYFGSVVIVLSLFKLIFPETAYAYLDPGTGSLFLQLIIAVAIGSAFAVKVYWRKIISFFVNLFKNKKK